MRFPSGSSAVANLVRKLSWSETPLGTPETWPTPLRYALDLCLNTAAPSCVYWGTELRLLYNDAWSVLAGDQHPALLGQPWPRNWDALWPGWSQLLAQVFRSGTPALRENHALPILRNGVEAECYFTHHSTPIRSEDGAIAGVLQGLVETTAHVLSKRRSRTFERLVTALAAAHDPLTIATETVRTLATLEQDVPCVAFYLRTNNAQDELELQAMAGSGLPGGALPRGGPFAPARLPLTRNAALLPPWAREAAQPPMLPSGSVLYQVQSTLGAPVALSHGMPVHEVLLLPLPGASRDDQPSAYLLCGLNPRLRLDESYCAFFVAVASAAGGTLRKSLEREAEQQQLEVHRLALETGLFGTWTLDLATSMLQLSTRAADLLLGPAETPGDRVLGTQPGSYPVERILARYHHDDRASVRASLATPFEDGSGVQFEARLPAVAGEDQWLWMRGRFYRDAAGRHCMTGLVGDISERKRAERLLRETEKLAAAGRLAATIAHEINNPLESVTNLIYLASLDQALSPKTARLLRSADAELSRVTHIAQQTLGFYRDNRGPVRVDIHRLVSELVGLFEQRPDRRGIHFDLSGLQHHMLFCLQGELRQVLSNLVANAVQASRDGATVRIRARESTRWQSGQAIVRLTVADRGSGITAADRGKVFTAFFTTKRDIGNGLGLWVSKSILEKQGGTIRFRSRTGEASGTCFMITVPTEISRSMTQ